MWRSSVVRMKSSYSMFISFHRSLVSATILSTNCCGVTPACFAFSSIFWPCSSVPVRKKVS